MANKTTLHHEEILEVFDWSNLHDHQKIFIRTRARNPLAIGAVGSGKTRAAICRGICLSTDTPYFGNLAGNKGIIGRLKRTDLEDTTMADFLELIGPTGWIKKYPKQPRFICELINGSIIQFVALEDYQKFYSRELGWAYFEQIEEKNQQKTFEEIDEHRLRRTKTIWGKPVLFHTAFAVCNPCENWVYDLWGRNEEKLESPNKEEKAEYNPDLLCLHSSTYENKENLPLDYISNMETKYGGRNSKKGKMYLQGLWGSIAGNVYDWNPKLVNKEDYWPPLEQPTRLSIDYGWGSEGVTSIGFWALNKIRRGLTEAFCYDELYLKGNPHNGISETIDAIDNTLQFHYVKRLDNSSSFPKSQKVDIELTPCDPAMQSKVQRVGKEDIEETILQAFERVASSRGFYLALFPANNNIALGTDRVNWFINNKLVRFNPRCRHHISSLKHYIWDIDHPEKPALNQDDHPADDTRYGLMSLDINYHQPKEQHVESIMERILRKRKSKLKETQIELGSLLLR